MAQRKFNIVDPKLEFEQIEQRQRLAKRSLIGGSLEKRREFGKASGVQGEFILDPIFIDADLQRAREHCAPDPLRPLVIEIGFQMGVFATAYCLREPNARYIGFEVRRKFCEEANARLLKHSVPNALLCLVDAREMLSFLVEPATLDELFVFFPDPWWKYKHIRKRLISEDFIENAVKILKPGGRLLLKTDVYDYSTWAEGMLRENMNFDVTRLDDPRADLPPTLRERRCMGRGEATYAVQAIRRITPTENAK